MTGHQGLGDAVPVVGRPAVRMQHRRREQRRVGDASGEHDVGPVVERSDDRTAAEVRVGGQRIGIVELVQDVVAQDDRDARPQPERPGERRHHRARTAGVGGAGVRHDARPSIEAGREHGVHPLGESGVEPGVRIASPLELAQGDRPLGQALEHEEVEVAPLGQVDGRIDAVVAEAGSRPDAHRSGHPSMFRPIARHVQDQCRADS